jgi:hypothetical protein
MTTFSRWALPVLAGLAALGAARADDTFPDLLRRVPPQANAVLFLDADAVAGSRLAVREKWGQPQDSYYVGGVSPLARSVSRLVAASQFSPGSLENSWEVGLLQVPKQVTAAGIARAEAGALDTVAGTQVVLLPRNAYAAVLEPGTVGMQRPANRQELGRWLRLVAGKPSGPGSPYLAQAAALAGREAPVVMAIDLADVFDSAGVRRRLEANPILRSQKADLDGLTRLLAGLKGITLLIRVDDAIAGEARLDFAESPAVLAGLAKPLVQNALDSMGARLDELESWQSEVRGNAVVLHGPLSRAGARLLLSPLLHPATAVETQPPAAPATAPAPQYDPRMVASLRYFHSVKTILDDLYNRKVTSFANLAYWYNKQAKAIDELPVLNVDEELLKYGMSVSTTLRQLATLGRGVGETNKITEMNVTDTLVTIPNAYNYSRWGPNWGYSWSLPATANYNNYGAVYGMMATNTAAEGQIRSKTWENINNATADARRKMTQKYNVEFK